jgi:hypothetical protein
MVPIARTEGADSLLQARSDKRRLRSDDGGGPPLPGWENPEGGPRAVHTTRSDSHPEFS